MLTYFLSSGIYASNVGVWYENNITIWKTNFNTIEEARNYWEHERPRNFKIHHIINTTITIVISLMCLILIREIKNRSIIFIIVQSLILFIFLTYAIASFQADLIIGILRFVFEYSPIILLCVFGDTILKIVMKKRGIPKPL